MCRLHININRIWLDHCWIGSTLSHIRSVIWSSDQIAIWVIGVKFCFMSRFSWEPRRNHARSNSVRSNPLIVLQWYTYVQLLDIYPSVIDLYHWCYLCSIKYALILFCVLGNLLIIWHVIFFFLDRFRKNIGLYVICIFSCRF